MRARNGFSVRVPVVVDCVEEGAKQSFQKECDINYIMSRYEKTGTIAHVNNYSAMYGFASAQSFQEALQTVMVAQEMFDSLPAAVRARCGNDPAVFLEFVADEKNVEEMRKLGIVSPTTPKAATLDDVVSAIKAAEAAPHS